MEAVVLMGIQATGKSSFFKERFADSHVRINLDMLKTRSRERILLEACVAAKQPFVVDNTNPTREDRARYLQVAKDAGFRVIGYFFRSRVGEALERNRRRAADRRVEEVGIKAAAKRLELPAQEEGFDELWFVSLEGEGFKVTEWLDEVR